MFYLLCAYVDVESDSLCCNQCTFDQFVKIVGCAHRARSRCCFVEETAGWPHSRTQFHFQNNRSRATMRTCLALTLKYFADRRSDFFD